MKKIVLTTLAICLLLLNACARAAFSEEDSPVVIDEATVNILIQELALDPAEIAIHVGTTVTWFNMDAARHTITADKGEFDSPVLLFGDSFSFTFNELGEFSYSNKYHRDIKGKIVVVP